MTSKQFNYANLGDYYGTITANLLRDSGFEARKYKDEIRVVVPKGIGDVKIQKADNLLSLIKRVEGMFMPKENIYEEPPDAAVYKTSGQFPEEKLPEDWSKFILPAGKNIGGKKADIDRLKEWVEQKKFLGKTQDDLLEEYNELKGREQDTRLSAQQKKNMIDSIALKVSRKIWYVGRKAAQMTDWEWNEITKHMRPPKGSYSRNEKWTNMKFPYTQAYIYTSGR
jgi:hypothetical protein